MSVPALKWAISQKVGDATAKSVLMVLAWHHNPETGLCCPSIPTIQTECDIKSCNTVKSALKRLAAMGLLSSERDIVNGSIKRTRYTLLGGSAIEGGSAVDGGSVIEGGSVIDPPHRQQLTLPPSKFDPPLCQQLTPIESIEREEKKEVCDTASFESVSQSYTPAESYTPAGNCTPVENCSTPLQETAGDPCRKLQTNKKVISKEEVSYCDPASFETVSQSASDFGFGLEAEDFGGSTKTGSTNFGMTEEKPKKAAKKRAQTHRFDLDSLPEDWRKVAQDMRPDLDADKVFASFRFYWTTGRGEGTLRSDKSWATSWTNWLRKEAEGNRRTMASPSAEPVGTNSTDPAELRRQYWALQKQKKEAEEREAALIFGVAA